MGEHRVDPLLTTQWDLHPYITFFTEQIFLSDTERRIFKQRWWICMWCYERETLNLRSDLLTFHIHVTPYTLPYVRPTCTEKKFLHQLDLLAPGFQLKGNSTTSDLPFFFVTGTKSDVGFRHRACGPLSAGLTLRWKVRRGNLLKSISSLCQRRASSTGIQTC